MVVFTCNHCGDSLQKPKVAKHYQFQCRNHPDLTCVDCHKDYRGDEYTEHTSCFTENERYGGKDYVAKPSSNKGERKQNEWMNVVQNVLKNEKALTSQEKHFLHQISHHKNLPRKKAKFFNFIKSSLGNRVNSLVVESVWTKMENAFKETKQSVSNNQTEDKPENGTTTAAELSVAENENNENLVKETEGEEKTEVTEKKKKSKKRKHESEDNSAEPADKKSNTDCERNENSVQENGNANESAVSEKKKKSKKRKMESEVNVINENNENEAKEEGAAKKKKAKKEAEENSVEMSEIPAEAEVSEKKKKKAKKETEENSVEKSEIPAETEISEKKKKKKKNKGKIAENGEEMEVENEKEKQNETEAGEVGNVESKSEKFDWKNVIVEVLTQKGGKMALQKLQKKVVGRYVHQDSGRSQEKGVSKFEKTLKKMDNVTVEEEVVKLLA